MNDHKPAMPERIFQRNVSIMRKSDRCLILTSTDQGGSSGGMSSGSLLAMTRPVVARNVHDSVSYLKAYLTGDMAALPETRESTDDDRNEAIAGDRQVAVRTARNGFIVEPAHHDGNGWMKALGDEVVFTELTEMLRFCMDHLEGVPGTNWWEVSPWKEGRAQ